nr:MAG TPA: hypothetical protein [Caudoviricetes sp.]
MKTLRKSKKNQKGSKILIHFLNDAPPRNLGGAFIFLYTRKM